MKKLIVSIVLFLVIMPLYAQSNVERAIKNQDYTNPDELVTISEFTPFDKAIEVLSQVSERHSGKKIISTARVNSPIGVEINKVPYMKALLIIVQFNNLVYEEKANIILVRKKLDNAKNLAKDKYAPLNSREVKISAIFFEADVRELRERGINWEWLLSSTGVTLGSNLRTFSEEKKTSSSTGGAEEGGSSSANSTQKPPEYLLKAANEFVSGNFSGKVEGVFKFFESENLGEIIARPKVIVRDKMKGRLQIGSDISIKQRDFSGNIIDKFYSTGTIIEVSPNIYTEDNIDYILLNIKAERSSAIPGEITTEIKKTTVETNLMMLSGEETVIGGLFINDEVTVRQGIPFLKDLPWWVFGIRYLTGYDKVQVSKKEIIILLKVDLVPTLRERVARKKENLINKQILEDHENLKKYKLKPFRDKEFKIKQLSDVIKQ
jgi:type IV pilus assembly protein PilQ